MRVLLFLFLLSSTVFSLGPYNIDLNGITVGGLSSGAYFAVQYQIAYSSTIRGAAIFAGGPYYCAEDELTYAVLYCMSAMTPNPSYLASYAKEFESDGYIDSLMNLKSQAVFIYSGTSDYTVKQDVVKTLVAFYGYVGLNNITTQFQLAAGHGYPTLNYGVSCSQTSSPYITNCNYDGAGASLKTLYGSLSPKGMAKDSNVLSFDQSPFTNGNPSAISLGPTGYAYVPTACQSGAKCKLHINFHGCAQTISDIGNVYYTKTGLNDWAESNNIVILYPQAQDTILSNPNGCWDWWGYTNSAYVWKKGSQMAAVKAMIDQITGH